MEKVHRIMWGLTFSDDLIKMSGYLILEIFASHQILTYLKVSEIAILHFSG